MCDYSLHNVKTRPAQVGDKLTTRLFGWSTGGFAASEDKSVAVCLSPGTELSFAEEVRKVRSWPWFATTISESTKVRKCVERRTGRTPNWRLGGLAEAPMIAQSRVSSVNFFPKASLCRVPPTHSGKNHLKGLKRRFDMMWFVIFNPLVSLYVIACRPFGPRRYRSFYRASWLP